MEIVNYCAKLPLRTLSHIRNALAWIDMRDMKGIRYIQLLDNIPEPDEKSVEWYRSAREKGYGIFGWYAPQTQLNQPYIALHISDILKNVPSIYLFSPVPTLLTTRTLAHEVAHHLAAYRGYIFKNGEKIKNAEAEERLANSYAFNTIARMQRHWYYRLGYKLIQHLAKDQFFYGSMYWKKGMYSEAEKRWYKAYCLNPGFEDAAYWYFRAKELNNQKVPTE